MCSLVKISFVQVENMRNAQERISHYSAQYKKVAIIPLLDRNQRQNDG
jgi:NADH:ubiquinone oxidoreductase subunit E